MSQFPSSDAHAASRQVDLEEALERFEAAWQTGKRPRLDLFVPPLSPGDSAELLDERRKLLEELIKVDLEYSWRKPKKSRTAMKDATTVQEKSAGGGSRQAKLPAQPHLEDYLRSAPELGSLDKLPLELAVEEYRVRRRWGDKPGHDLYLVRFPHFAAELPQQLARIDAEQSRRPADDTTFSRSDVMLAEDQGDLPAPASARVSQDEELPKRIGRYSIKGLLGKGAFGRVYLGFDEELHRLVAVKVPRMERLRSTQTAQIILREARLAAQLRHPALVEVFDVGREPDGTCFIVMEFIDGEPLSKIIDRGPVPLHQTVQWIFQIAEAVHCAHKVGLVHGDLKPGNILIDQDGQPHVADFGLAVTEEEQRKMAGHVAGTPAYMAPEQVRGEAHRLDGRTDLWSIGAMFYELLTGRLPFDGDSVSDVFDEIQNRDPRPPRQIDDSIPAELEWVCLKCLAKPVTQRYTTAMDLARDLRQALEDTPLDLKHQTVSLRFKDRYQSEPSRALFTQPAKGRGSGSSQTRAAAQTNLSANPTSFVGRQQEVEELSRWLLNPDVSLVTLLGPGGIGKTRLAKKLATELLAHFPGGCWFAELADARFAPRIAHAVAEAFGIPLTGSEPPEQVIANVLEYRKPLLLVLDNFEQAVEFAQGTVGLWRQRAPHISFLVTSRSPLGLAGEREYELQPLPTPAVSEGQTASPAEIAACDSVKLFCAPANEVHPGFTLDAETAQAVAQICAELEGLPLAVELAAARVKMLKPTQIAKKLGQKFQLLQSPRRDLTARQQTLTGAIDWSYDLLGDWEQQAFMQCSIFRGGFFLDAADAVIDLAAFPQAPLTLDVVQSLREKSLLKRQDTQYEARYVHYKSLREYAEAKWQATATEEQKLSLWQRFAKHCVEYAESWNARLHTADAPEALDRLQLKIMNLFAVQSWAVSANEPVIAARAVLAVAETMAIRGPADRRVWRLEQSLGVLPADSLELRARLLTAVSDACQAVGTWDKAVAAADEAVQVAERMGDDSLLAEALCQQGAMRRHRGEIDDADRCFIRCESLHRQAGDRLGWALTGRGNVLWQHGDSDQALRCYAEADDIAHEFQDPILTANLARHRGHVLWQRGDFNGALKCYAEAEAIARPLGDQRLLHLTIGNRGIVLAEQGDYDGATQCYADAETLARKLGDKRGIAINVGNRGIAMSDRGDPRGAILCYAKAEAINREMQTKFGIAVNVGNRGNALADLGDYDGALSCFAEAEALNAEMGNRFLRALNIGDRGAALIKLGCAAEARESLKAALALLDEINTQHSPEYFGYQTMLAQAEQQAQNLEEVARLAAAARQLASKLLLTENHPKLKTRELLIALRGLLPAGEGERLMILEGLVTTVCADGRANLSPMGPRVNSPLTSFTLKPYRTSTTYANLKRHGEGVLHVTDDVELLAQCAVGAPEPLPAMRRANAVEGWIVIDACRWYAFRVARIDDSQERSLIEAQVVDSGVQREFFGFNRAKHAVLEAAILATRVKFLPANEIREEMRRLAPLVEKTGGPAEERAFAFLQKHVFAELTTASALFG